jgi:hypothetical protein
MATLSQYWFDSDYFAGSFRGWNEPVVPGRSTAIAGIPPFSGSSAGSAATLAHLRPDDEMILPIAASVNANTGALAAIDGLLGTEANRTSPIRAAGIPWGPRLPYFASDPARHDSSEMIVRISFDIHVTTPVGCWDLDGTVSYYLMFFLDAQSRLKAFVDASGWQLGWKAADVCRDAVRKRLSSGVDNGVATLQALVDLAIAKFAPGRMVETYLLPGSGTTATGAFQEDADADVVLVVRPFRINPAVLTTAAPGVGGTP